MPFDYSKLDPERRCQALVGRFLQHWALTERELEKCITMVLNLSLTQSLILMKNIQLRDKINILKTLVSVSPLPEEEIKDINKGIDQFSEFSLTRNMMAHDSFHHLDEGFVTFVVVQAKGDLKLPDAKWTIDDFENADETNWRFMKFFEKLESRFKAIEYARALMKGSLLPMLGLPALDLTNPERPPAPKSPGSGPWSAMLGTGLRRLPGRKLKAPPPSAPKKPKQKKLSSAQKRALREKGDAS